VKAPRFLAVQRPMSGLVFTTWGKTLMHLVCRKVEGVHVAGVFFTPVLGRE